MSELATSLESTPADFDFSEGMSAFTFWINETLYAVEISKVLTISQELANIQTMPSKGKGLLGMTEFQGQAIPVVDFANMLGLKSGTEYGQELISIFESREKDHHDWLDSLEHSIRTGEPFTKARDPNKCAFGAWYNSFKCRDETLMNILEDFDEPHQRIHALADKLLNMQQESKVDDALNILDFEKKITMKRLSRHFSAAREQIRDANRMVLLYITEDGVQPTIALRIDEIYDVIDISAHQFKPMKSLKNIFNIEHSKLLTHYIKLDNTADCLLVDSLQVIDIIKKDRQ